MIEQSLRRELIRDRMEHLRRTAVEHHRTVRAASPRRPRGGRDDSEH